MRRKRASPDGPLPSGKSRGEIHGRLYAPLQGRAGKEWTDTFEQINEALRKHPDTAAAAAIEEALAAAHQRPEVAASPELSRFVVLMRDLLAEHVPGMTLRQMLEPLATLLSNHGGGRPPKERP